jgi:hypothetical protein
MSLATRFVFLGEMRWLGEVNVSFLRGVEDGEDEYEDEVVGVMALDASETGFVEDVSASARAAFSKEEDAVMEGGC